MSRIMKIHDAASVDMMYKAGRIAALALDAAEDAIKPGITTGELDAICDKVIRSHGGFPDCIGYNGYQHASCISPNEVICHGIPGDTVLKEGDIVNVDVVARYWPGKDISDGQFDKEEALKHSWLGDTSRTFAVGKVGPAQQKLIDVAKEAMYVGIKSVRKGLPFKTIGFAIDNFLKKQIYNGIPFKAIPHFCGHGISRYMHEEPSVEYIRNGCEVPIKPYQYFTIEPVIVYGRDVDCKLLDDGWAYVSPTGLHSTQWEHTIGVDEDGHIMITTTRDANHELKILTEIFGPEASKFFRDRNTK